MNNKIRKNKKSKLTNGLIVLILAGMFALTFILIINAHVKSSVKGRIVTPDEAASMGADCILVLGAGVRDNGRPSPMLVDRLLQGIELYNNGFSDRLLMSGDHGRKEYDEVNVMKQFAIDRGLLRNMFLWIMRVFPHTKVCTAQEIFLKPRGS